MTQNIINKDRRESKTHRWDQMMKVIILLLITAIGHLVAGEVDLIDLGEDLEGRPGQSGEQVSGKQQNLERTMRNVFIIYFVHLSVGHRKLLLLCGVVLSVKEINSRPS